MLYYYSSFSFVRARTVAKQRKVERDQAVLAEMESCFAVTNATAVQIPLSVRTTKTEDGSLKNLAPKKIWQTT